MRYYIDLRIGRLVCRVWVEKHVDAQLVMGVLAGGGQAISGAELWDSDRHECTARFGGDDARSKQSASDILREMDRQDVEDRHTGDGTG